MCFSAPASFVASAALAIVGTVVVVRVQKRDLFPLALIPWLLAIQQAAEGFVWLSLPNASFAKDLYLFFAYSFWPIWIPIAAWIAENQKRRKTLLALCTVIGSAVGIYQAFLIPETTAESYSCSINYTHSSRNLVEEQLAQIFYALATIAPLFLSSIPRMWVLGALIAISGAAVFWVNQVFIVSMWCFFAGVFSITLFFILKPSRSKR